MVIIFLPSIFLSLQNEKQMPITVHADVRRMAQEEFAQVAYDFMQCVFAVHNEMGRFFSEEIYRDAITRRFSDAQREVQIVVRFEDFVKEYFIDLLVSGGAIFELKTVSALTTSHRSQLLNYLLLTGLSHGKLVNLRPVSVEHEFVNTSLTKEDCIQFDVDDRNWREVPGSSRPLAPWFVSLLHEIGAGLILHLYEDAVMHFLGGEEVAVQDVEVLDNTGRVGNQKLRLAVPGWSFRITALDSTGHSRFEEHVRRFLNHTHLHGIQWINVTRKQVVFRTISK